MDVPNVSRTEYQLVRPILMSVIVTHMEQVNIDDGFLNLMTQDGTSKDDVKIPESDLGSEIQSGFDDGKDLLVTIISAMGEEQVWFTSASLFSSLTATRPFRSRKHLKETRDRVSFGLLGHHIVVHPHHLSRYRYLCLITCIHPHERKEKQLLNITSPPWLH